MRRRWTLVLVLIAIATAIVGLVLSKDHRRLAPITDIATADRVLLTSVDGSSPQYRELGSILLSRQQAADASKALAIGVLKDKHGPAACFIPRHRIDTWHGTRHTVLMICFQCHRIKIGRDGSLPTEPDAEPLLNRILDDARIPRDEPTPAKVQRQSKAPVPRAGMRGFGG